MYLIQQRNNAGCPYCGGNHSLKQNEGKIECGNCEKIFTIAEWNEWVALLDDLISQCNSSGFTMHDLTDSLPPFAIGPLAIDRQKVLKGELSLEIIIDPEYCRERYLTLLDRTRRPKLVGVFSSALYKAFTQRHPHLDKSQKVLFSKDGDIWNITYQRKPRISIKHQVGLEYIAYLVDHPGKRFITPLELEVAVTRSPMESDTVYGGMSEERLAEGGLSTQGLKARETTDKRALDQYKKRLEEVSGAMEAAEKNHDEAQVDVLTKEKEQLLRQLRNAWPENRGQWDHENEKARKRISAAILRAIAEIDIKEKDKKSSGLADHLSSKLKPVSFPYGYDPD